MGQNKPVKETIEGKAYEMYMLPPMVSHDLFVDVVKMVGPSLGPVIDKLFSKAQGKKVKDLMDMEIGADFFAKAADSLFQNLKKETIENLIEKFKEVTHVSVSGKMVPLTQVFDIHFQGDLGPMYKWLGWGMKVQWGKSLSTLIGGVKIPAVGNPPVEVQEPPSPMASTG
jgi:hypothetical protein